MKKLAFLILFFTLLFSLSAENYIGFNNQYGGEYLAYGGFRGGITIFSISPLLGFSHTIEIKKRFSIENNLLFGYKYRTYGSSYGLGGHSNFHGFNFITDMNFFFRFGNDIVKFKFSVPSWIFTFAVGIENTTSYDWDDDGIGTTSSTSSDVDCYVYGGIKLINVGLNIYLGKEQNVLFTPIYLFGNLLWGYRTNVIPMAHFGIGAALKFKIIKKALTLD